MCSFFRRHCGSLALGSACLGALLVGSPVARADKLVAVLSSADPAYVLHRRGEDGKPKPQSYVFMQGSFHGGSTRDGGLEKMSFGELVRRIAPDLGKQAFYPAKKLEEADLLLVVHWGVTDRRQTTDEMLAHTGNEHQQFVINYNAATKAVDNAITSGATPPDSMMLDGAVVRARNEMNFDALQRAHETSDALMAQASAARLLGIDGELARDNQRMFGSEEGNTMRAMLNEERYFIVLVAYDCAELLKTKKLTRLWSTKLNVRSAGVNFFIALNRMSQVGGQFYASTTEHLDFEPARERKTSVEVGPLIVIESPHDTQLEPASTRRENGSVRQP